MLIKDFISVPRFVAISGILVGIAFFFGNYQLKLLAIAISCLITIYLTGRDIYILAKSKDKISDLPKWEKQIIEKYTYIDAIVLYSLSLFLLIPFISFGLPIIKLFPIENTISRVQIVNLTFSLVSGLMSIFCSIQATNIRRILFLRNIQNKS